jgi:hypothetical protein
LALDGGHTKGAEAVRILTPAGLEAASLELGRVMDEMGGIPRGAGSTGASHAMTVNETVIAMIRPKPDLTKLTQEPADAIAAAQRAVAGPPGIGTIASYATEVPLPATGTWSTAGKGGAQADVVLVAPEAGVPLLFIEVDNCFEVAATIAAKFDKYMRFYRRTVKDTDGREKAMWRTRWSAPPGRYGDVPHPPVLLVFHQVGPRPAAGQIKQVAALTRQHWQGEWDTDGGHHIYDGKIPIVATTLDLLREHGPTGPAFHRFGRNSRQCLLDAIGNPRRETADTRRHEANQARTAAYKAEQQRLADEKASEREARRPVCASCGTKFTDDRWEAAAAYPKGGPQWYPKLCEACEDQAITAEEQSAENERQREAETKAGAEQRIGGWCSRFRT